MIIRLAVSEEIPRPVVEWTEYILRERTHGTVLWPGVVRNGVASKPQRMSSLIRRSNYHQLTEPFHELEFKDYSATFSWTSCKSSGHGLLIRARCMSWSLIGQFNTTVAPCGLRVVDRRLRPFLGLRNTCVNLDVLLAAWIVVLLETSVHA